MKGKNLNSLKADTYRLTKSTSFSSTLKSMLFNRSFRPIATLRLCQYFNDKNSITGKIMLSIFRVIHKWSCNKAGVDLSWSTSIGPGFALTHGWGTVIYPKVTIGSNVTIFQGVTIGGKRNINGNMDNKTTYPRIGNNVWIGANSVIVGDVNIGEGSIIAPLSMVYEDINSHTSIGNSNPIKILRENIKEDVHNKADII